MADLRSRLSDALDGTRFAADVDDASDEELDGLARDIAATLRYKAARGREEGDGLINEAARMERLAAAVEEVRRG